MIVGLSLGPFLKLALRLNNGRTTYQIPVDAELPQSKHRHLV